MKFILKILFVLMLIVFTIVIVGLFLPQQHKIVKKIEIKVPREIVYEQLYDFNNWKNWSPWAELDSTLEIIAGDKSKGQLAEVNWKSKLYGSSRLRITHAVAPESVAVEFDFGTKSTTTSLWYIEPTPTGCELNWTMNLTKLSLPERYFAFFQKKRIEQIVEHGLERLEQRSVELKYSRTGQISSIDLPAIPTVVIVDSVRPENVQSKLIKDDAYLLRFFERRELKPAGKAFKLIYGEVNDTLEKYGYGYPLEERTWVWRTLKAIQFPEGKAITISHFGRQRNTNTAHKEVEDYIHKNGLELNGIPWEVYLFDAKNDIDTSLWETQIYYPIK